MYLSIVIPAYNEAHRLPATLLKVKEYLSHQSYDSEIIVVNDGSTDRTSELVQEIQKTTPNLRLLDNTENKGKGAVVKQGMLAAKGDYCLFMDADASTPLQEVEKLLKGMLEADICIGSRYYPGSKIIARQPLKRRLLSRASNLLIQAVATPGIHDTQCGFKLYTQQATQIIFPLQHEDGWLFDVELLVIARQKKLKIVEVAVQWSDVTNSTLRASQAALASLTELWRIYWRIRQKSIGTR